MQRLESLKHHLARPVARPGLRDVARGMAQEVLVADGWRAPADHLLRLGPGGREAAGARSEPQQGASR